MKRKVIIIFISVIICAIMFATLIMMKHNVYSVNRRSAIIAMKEGKVLIRRAGEDKWQFAESGDALYENDSIKTMSRSKVILRFDNGAMTKLGPLTVLFLNELSFKRDMNSTILDIKVGKIWLRAKKLNIKMENFNVETPMAVAGVRGTYASSEVEEDLDTTFDVYEGKIDVSRKDAPSIKVLVGENQRTYIKRGENPTLPQLIPQEDLKEARKEFPEKLYERCKFDIKVKVEPKEVKVGETAVVDIQLLRNGEKYNKSVLFKVSLEGSAKFVDNMSQTIEIMSDENGHVSLRVTDEVEEKIKVNVDVELVVEK